MKSFTLPVLALATTALAKTDLAGCTSSAVGASLLWYVPESGEICSILDCGGGRAPPKTTVPGCAAYQGTATYTPSFIPGYGQATATKTSELYSTTMMATPSSYTPTGQTTTEFYSTTIQASYTSGTATSELYSTTIMATPSSYYTTTVRPNTTEYYSTTIQAVPTSETLVTSVVGSNATGIANGTASSTRVPPEQSTGGAVVNGVAQGVVGVAVGVMAMML